MNKKVKLGISVAVFVVFLLGAGVLYKQLSSNYEKENPQMTSQNETSEEKAEIIQAPNVSFYDADGTKHSLSDMRGKPVILNFWASWCPPCKMEMPEFEKMYQKYGDEVLFLMVNMTDGERETKENALAFIKEQGYTFPIYFDLDFDVAYTYGVRSLPMTFFIDPDGNVVRGYSGMINESVIQDMIKMIKK